MANRNDEALRALREAIGLADLAARLDRNAEDRAERADAYLSLNNARCGAHEFIRLHGDALLAALSRPEPAEGVEWDKSAKTHKDARDNSTDLHKDVPPGVTLVEAFGMRGKIVNHREAAEAAKAAAHAPQEGAE